MTKKKQTPPPIANPDWKQFTEHLVGLLPKRPPRDPARIPTVLALLKEYWEKHPDLRLGQVLGNFVPHDKDAYYLEDTDLITKLQAALRDEP